MKLTVYIIVMAGVTYLIRMLPFAFFGKKIKSQFFRSLLYYIPYAVLSAMTIPAIFYSTGSYITAAVGTAAAIALAYFGLPLIAVALAAAAAAFITGFFI
ncbi:AzlD domain-containing protein [uncultured Ruminococcus sp.]|uniref:AzlD domain-containing protein n=1 Tax=uncultured Ruminococcus sp. TaxID=165186 RepID=UPI00263293C2|nr:AzlD domain-containing protein [uncultured Ruminococcus sp.]